VKKILVVIIALIVLSLSLHKSLLYFSYALNQPTIAATLCLKKSQSNNDCQGKCYLKNQLNEADKQEKKHIPLSLKDFFESLFFFNPFSVFQVRAYAGLVTDLYFPSLSSPLSSQELSGVFQPPSIF
jgi:hypothetical protein